MPTVPFGNDDGLNVIVGQSTVIEYAWLPVHSLSSVAVTVKLNIPDAVGVPEISPVDKLRFKPPGSEPVVTAKVYGLVPPLAETVWLYDMPTTASGKDDGLKVIVGHEEDLHLPMLSAAKID